MKASFDILMNEKGVVLLEDLDGYRSITNDAEAVVNYLFNEGIINENKTLFYIDTLGQVDQLKFNEEGHFQDFVYGYPNKEAFYEYIKSRG